MKICLVASTGGHLSELLRLADVWRDRTHFFVTPGALVADHTGKDTKTYTVCRADYRHPLQLVRMLGQCARIVLKERPDVILSTGAAVGCLICLLGKLLGKKVIWVETISHVDRLTLSGKIVRHFADVFLVQWPELAGQYKQARYVGSIL